MTGSRRWGHWIAVWTMGVVVVFGVGHTVSAGEGPGDRGPKPKLKMELSVALDPEPIQLPATRTREGAPPFRTVSSVDLLCTATNVGDADVAVPTGVVDLSASPDTPENTLWVRSGEAPVRPVLLGVCAGPPPTRVLKPSETGTWRIRDVHTWLRYGSKWDNRRQLGVHHVFWKFGDSQSNEIALYQERARKAADLGLEEATEELARLNKKAQLDEDERRYKQNLEGYLKVLELKKKTDDERRLRQKTQRQ